MAKVHKPTKNEDGTIWEYPRSKDVLEEVGLFTIDEYIQRRRNAIAMYVAERPVFALCVNVMRVEDLEPATIRNIGGSKHLLWRKL